VVSKVREIAESENDRIWVLQYEHDLIYVNSDRLPAIMFTQSPPLEQRAYSDDRIYRLWYDQFVNNRPRVVVNYFTTEFLSSLNEQGIVLSENLQKISAIIASSMDRVDYVLDYPEIYSRRE